MSWEPALPYAILLQDIHGYKENKLVFGYSSGFSNKYVLRGTLLVRLSQDEVREVTHQSGITSPLNFKVLKEPAVKLYCKVNNVLLLNYKQKELLLAIGSTNDRLGAVDKVEWAEKLTEESTVYVSIPIISTSAKGIVHYIGKLPGEDGTKFGVELLEHKYCGTSDGIFKDEQYFKCGKDCGVFVGLDRLSDRFVPVVTKPLNSATAGSSASGSKNSKNLQKQKSVEQQQQKQLYFKIGERVMAFDYDEGIVHGTVRWTGGSSSGKLVGIETDVPVNNKKFGGYITGMYHMFTPSGKKGRDYQLFLPYTCILPENSKSAGGLEASITTQVAMKYAENYRQVPDDIREQQTAALEKNKKEADKQKAKHVLKLDERDIDDTMNAGTLQEILDKIKQKRESIPTQQGSGAHHSQGGKSDFNQGNGETNTQQNFQRNQKFYGVSEQLAHQSGSNQGINPQPYLQNQPIPSESSLPEATQLRKDLKTLEDQIELLSGDRDGVNSTVTRLHRNFSEMEKKFENLQTQMSYNQQKTEESIQRMEINVDNAFRKALEVQKNYEELQKFSAQLINQLSLTQQQLLGVQSMMTSSRLWVVSHDQFTIGREIGRGAWATVHETTFRGATVAAKCLHQLINAPRTRQLFQREMEMALQCQHQNIVTFLGATLEGHQVILMELMDTSLRNAYEGGNIRDHQVLGIFYNIASALHFLHTRPDPVIHRDVSSANVLLKALYNGVWLAKLGDLGTAKLQLQAGTANPGAMAYGAPEAGDYTKHSPKMDIYSYGILILEILTTTHPFEVVDALKAQVQQQFPQYHQLVTSCTNQQSSDRPTMYDVIGQLNKIKTARP